MALQPGARCEIAVDTANTEILGGIVRVFARKVQRNFFFSLSVSYLESLCDSYVRGEKCWELKVTQVKLTLTGYQTKTF